MAALALAHAGCDSRSPERTPTGPQPPASGDEGRLSAMAVAPPLGAADPFGVLGASTVTNTGPTVITGDMGVSPGTSCTGFPAPCTGGPGAVTGTIHVANATSLAAQNAIVTAYNALTSQACDVILTGTDLGGLTLTPGTYCFATSAQLTGTLTLDGLGNAGAVWVFKIGSTLTTASNSRVVYINFPGQPCGTFWQVGSSATLGTGTAFSGNILALASITMNTGADNVGGLFARTGAVTLDTNDVSRIGSCGGGPQPSPTPLPTPGPGPSPVPAMPNVAMLGLVALLLIVGVFVLGRR